MFLRVSGARPEVDDSILRTLQSLILPSLSKPGQMLAFPIAADHQLNTPAEITIDEEIEEPTLPIPCNNATNEITTKINESCHTHTTRERKIKPESEPPVTIRDTSALMLLAGGSSDAA